jgi:signal transduction histidine kinase
MLGRPLTKLFALGEDGDGGFPILGGLAMHRRFEDQRATIRATGCPVRLSAAARTDASGAFAGFIGAAKMVDEEAPAALPTPKGSADEVTEAFAARLDQALRAPLGRIIANADSIHAQSEGPLRQDYADYAADIASAGRHLMGLVDDLVDLQAIERPDFVVAKEAVDLADVARRAAGLLAVRASEAHVRIDKPGAQDVLSATGEFRRALQVLVNLIGNAVRYSPADGMVWIRAERENGIAAVIVADQGKGIALADQARIFEKFERVDPREPGGSGLGLYIARRLARAMGGDVTVDSAPGQGARFIFTLPYREE